jgi:hypothetical protein
MNLLEIRTILGASEKAEIRVFLSLSKFLDPQLKYTFFMQDPQFFQKFPKSVSLLVINDQSQGSPDGMYKLIAINDGFQYSPISINFENGQYWYHQKRGHTNCSPDFHQTMFLGIEILESITNQFQTKFFEFKQFPHLFGEKVYSKIIE